MKKVSIVLDQLLLIAKDAKIWFRVLVLVVAGFAGAILFSRTKVRVEDCTTCNVERRELLNALLEIKKELSVVSYVPMPNDLIFASVIDTLPKRQQQQMQQQQIRKVMSKIDSILLKVYRDSVNRSKHQTKI